MVQVSLDQASVQRTDNGVAVTFPDALLVASKEDLEQFRRRVLVYTLGPLYEQGKISSGLGAQILGCDRWEFYTLLSQYGFSVIDYAEDEMVYEAGTSRELAQRYTILDDDRGPLISESRVTVFDVLEAQQSGAGLYEICTIFNLSPLQVQTAFDYVEAHRPDLEAELILSLIHISEPTRPY